MVCLKKVVILSLVCALLCACTAGIAAPDLSGTDFTADVAFSLGGRDYAATYTKAAGTETLVFGAPESLCGMTAVRGTDGAIKVTVGDLCYAAEAADGMFGFTALFVPPADTLRFVSETDGERCFSGSDGADSYTVYTDPEGLPLRLCGTVDGREYDIQVLRFVRMERSEPQ